MAAPTETYIDPADGAANGNDHGGNAFVDGSFANATLILTKVGAFTAATCQAGDKIYLDDNGSGEVTAGLYTIQTRTDDNNVVLTADIRSGAPDPTDVRCDQHTGAVGLPWATVQHALDFTARDAANGDRFNVKAGTDDVLAAKLDFSAYGTPTSATPVSIFGYTTSAGDGGIGGISGGGAVSVINEATLDNWHFQDMHFHSSGAQLVVSVDQSCVLINCEIDNTSSDGLLMNNESFAMACYIHNCGGFGLQVERGSRVLYCVLENGANDFTKAINAKGYSLVYGCIVSVDGATDGILSDTNFRNVIINNSVYSNGGTGQGIIGNKGGEIILNNIVEGFSGVGGIGYDINQNMLLYGHNKAYNNTTNFSVAGGNLTYRNLGNNDALGASPFTNPGAGNFEVDTNVRAGAWPTTFKGISTDQFLDVGAAQREEPVIGPTLRGRNVLLRR